MARAATVPRLPRPACPVLCQTPCLTQTLLPPTTGGPEAALSFPQSLGHVSLCWSRTQSHRPQLQVLDSLPPQGTPAGAKPRLLEACSLGNPAGRCKAGQQGRRPRKQPSAQNQARLSPDWALLVALEQQAPAEGKPRSCPSLFQEPSDWSLPALSEAP